VRSMAVDSTNKCIIYAAIGNKVFKSIDCARTWNTPIYVDNEVTASIDAITLDPYNSSLVYIGISRGDVVKSIDGGANWQSIYRANNKIKKIVVDVNDTKIIYALTVSSGVYRTIDGGATWKKINDGLNKLKIGTQVNNIITILDQPANIYIATENGLATSTDRGETWGAIPIIPPQNKALINDMAVNYKNTKEIYYVTDTTFYRSIDGGKTWATIKTPSTRAGNLLLLDSKNPNTIYMGMRTLAK
jgi:photosystem II stability/assembly factor-like uncharacterized protein